jgi:hypothetical protein
LCADQGDLAIAVELSQVLGSGDRSRPGPGNHIMHKWLFPVFKTKYPVAQAPPGTEQLL